MVEWRNSGTKWAFWNRVLKYARKRCNDTWPFQDRKCPHCRTWMSEVGGYSTAAEDWCTDTMRCPQCDKSSRWHNEGIVAWTLPASPTPTGD